MIARYLALLGQNRPKILVAVEMVVMKEESLRPTEEVLGLKWMTPQKALKLLTYGDEREVVRTCLEFGWADYRMDMGCICDI